MALKATVYKASLNVADLDRNRYGDYRVTLAREPSENEERLVARLLAFALNADEGLAFTSDPSDTEEPGLSLRDLTGRIALWIEVGLPEPRRLKKACGRADRVLLYLFHGRQAALWWEESRGALEGLRNLEVLELAPEGVAELAALAERDMDFQVTVSEGQATVAHEGGIVELAIRRLQG